MDSSKTTVGRQIPFRLPCSEHYSEKYFVPHSGVSQAFSVIESALSELVIDPRLFRMFYIFGPQGSGKTHLLSVFHKLSLEQGISVEIIDGISDEDDWIRFFIDRYESLRREGGLLLVAAERKPQSAFANPHSGSRLRVASPIEINYPSEVELNPLLDSLAERHNFLLSPQMRNYLMRRLPGRPLSFDNIFSKISELSLAEGKPVNLGRAREVVEKEAGEVD